MALLKKPSADQTRARRMEVFRLKMRGLEHAAIARALQVSRNTIIRDAAWLETHKREVAINADKFGVLGDVMEELDEIKKQAMFYSSETENIHGKNNFLLTAVQAIDKKVRLMMDAGIIEAAPVDVNLSVEEVKKMSTEELLQKRAELLDRLKDIGSSGVERN